MDQEPHNIIGRGQVCALRDVFGVDLDLAVQRTWGVLNFCITRSNRDAYLHPVINFGIVNQVWVATSQTLEVILTPVVWLVNPNNRTCPWCLKHILSWIFGIPMCGHPMHIRCWRQYHTPIRARGGVIRCPLCNEDTRGCFVRVWL